MMAHSPTPWRYTVEGDDYTINDASGEFLSNDYAWCPTALNHDDALFAVKAVNSHADLLDLARTTKGFLDHWSEDIASGLKPTQESIDALKAQVEAAISQATGSKDHA